MGYHRCRQRWFHCESKDHNGSRRPPEGELINPIQPLLRDRPDRRFSGLRLDVEHAFNLPVLPCHSGVAAAASEASIIRGDDCKIFTCSNPCPRHESGCAHPYYTPETIMRLSFKYSNAAIAI